MNMYILLIVGIFLILIGLTKENRNVLGEEKKVISYEEEFIVNEAPRDTFKSMFGNADPWINRFNIDRQPKELMEQKQNKKDIEELKKIRKLMN